jgi:hypothetical protein
LICIREKDEALYDEIIEGTYDRKDGDKQISLDDCLKSSFSIEDKGDKKKQVKIDILPSDITPRLRINGRTIGHENLYSEGEYISNLEAYYSNIFRPFFLGRHYNMPSIFFVGNRKEETEEPEVELERELYKLFNEPDFRSKEFNGESGLKWLEYTYLKTSLSSKTSPQFYKDLVELASALDWIDGENEE